MRHLAIAAIVSSMAAISPAHAQTKLNEEAVHDLPQAFAAAFSRHDGHQLAALMADDIDFVTVGATCIHGKSDLAAPSQ